MESTCRICGRRGHWKAECPDRPRTTDSTSGSTAPAMTSTTVESEADSELMSLEFMQLPVISETALDDEPSPQKAEAIVNHVIFRGKTYLVSNGVNQNQVHKPGDDRNHATGVVPTMPLRSDFQNRESPSKAMTASWNFSSTELVRDELALFATHGTYGILDTGATKSVVGSALVPDLLRQLHPKVREQVKRCQCSVTVRFGNQGT